MKMSELILQEEAADALGESETCFRTLVEISTEGIGIINSEGNFLYVSPAYERLLGYTPEELLGQSFQPLVHPDDLPRVTQTFTGVFEKPKRPVSVEYRALHKNGDVHLAESIGKLLPDGNVVIYSRDITEYKEAERKLRASEEYFRSLIENGSDGIAVTDPEGNFTYISPSYERIWGWTADELLGRPFLPLIHPDDAPVAVENITRLMAIPGYVGSSEIRVRHKDGSWRVIEGQGKLLPNGNIVSNTRDVTERRQLEDDLRRLNEELEARVADRTAQLESAFAERTRLAEILEATTDMVAFATLEGQPLYVNRAGRRILGFADDVDVTSLSFADFYPPDVLELFGTVGIPTALREGAWSGEVTLKHRDGHPIPVSLVGILHRTPDGAPSHLSAIARDISEQQRVQHELRQAKESAETANKAKSTFLANMSHEIRTPMNAVIGMTGLLLNTPLNDKQRDFVETIRVSGDTLLTIINDILDFSKIEAGKMELVNRPFDLRACIESALDLLAPKAAEKGLDLVYEVSQNVPPGISGDDTRLRQIFVNLVSNAIKFTEQGEVVLSVNIGGAREDQNGKSALPPASFSLLHFSVRDTGIGIQADKLDRLFQSFTQLDPSSTRNYGGSGLGLAISRRLAELMGGTMWAESEGPGQGATFHFTLAAEAAPVPARHHLNTLRPELSGKRVLIVDDNATNRRILNLQLQNWGMLAQEAATPAEALEALRQGGAFDLALLDMNMPDMDGATLATEICRLHDPDHFPLVMLTSLGYQSHPDLEALECFAAYLTKPVKPSQLHDTLVTVFAEEEATNQTFNDAQDRSLQLSSANHLAAKYPLRILLTEDVQVNQKFALLALEEMGYRADVAANGLETLAAVLRQPYDVILMDVQMPEMDGLEATRRITEIWANKNRPDSLPSLASDGLRAPYRPYIIAMTANALQGDRELCLEAGMDDYISKPVYMEELRAVLERAGRNRSLAARQTQETEQEIISTRPLDATPLPDIDLVTLDKLLKRPTGQEIIAGYLNEGQEMLNALQSAVSRGDSGATREAAHRLKGSSSYMGINRVAALSSKLEQQGRQGVNYYGASTLAQLEEAFEYARQMLSKLIVGG